MYRILLLKAQVF